MRSSLIVFLLFSFVVISGCSNKNQVFLKHTDVEEAGFKGMVKSITTYMCSLDSSGRAHCGVWIRKFNAQVFKVEVLDTSGHDYFTTQYSYNNDGLLTKLAFSASAPFSPLEHTYLYSLSERKKTVITRTFGNSSTSIDSSIYLYREAKKEIKQD